MSAREQIFAALDALLGAVPDVESYERQPSGDPDGYPALALYDAGQELAEHESTACRYQLTVTVEGFVKGASGAAAHGALNALHAKAVAALMAEPPLGGLAELVEEAGQLRIDVAELASERRLGFAQDFTITFATPRGDPETLL